MANSMGWSQVETFLRILDPKTGAAAGNIINSAQTLPRTQAQIGQIANLSQQLQNPNLQNEVRGAVQDVKIAGISILTLQAMATAATVGMFILAYLDYKKRNP